MYNVLCVRVIDCLEETPHVSGGLSFREDLVLLLADLVEEGHSGDVLHHQVDVRRVVVGLVILDDVRVVKRVQHRDLVHDVAQVLAQSFLVQHLDGHFDVLVVLVIRQENFAKSARSEHLSLMVNVIVLFELVYALLPEALTSNELLLLGFVI